MLNNKYVPVALATLLKKTKAQMAFQSFKDQIESINELKNSQSGKVVLLGSGASVNDIDLGKLQDTNIIFMNNWHIHNEYLEIISQNNNCYHIVAPVHGPSTRDYWQDWITQVMCCQDVTYVLGINNYIDSLHTLDRTKGLNTYFYAPLLDRRIDTYHVSGENYSLENPIFGAGAVSVYALLLACFLGFDEIYLLGVDHSHVMNLNSEHNGRFYKHSGHTSLAHKPSIEELFSGQANTFMQYRSIRDFFSDKLFINLANEKSIVDVFERKAFSDVFN